MDNIHSFSTGSYTRKKCVAGAFGQIPTHRTRGGSNKYPSPDGFETCIPESAAIGVALWTFRLRTPATLPGRAGL